MSYAAKSEYPHNYSFAREGHFVGCGFRCMNRRDDNETIRECYELGLSLEEVNALLEEAARVARFRAQIDLRSTTLTTQALGPFAMPAAA